MGTLLRQCSRDLNENISTDRWLSYQQDKALIDSQPYYDSSLAWQGLMGGLFVHDKAKVRETIMKHESTFRQQVQELHRLYGRQRDLMNDIRKKGLRRPEEAKTSHPVLVPSYISFEGAKRTWNNSHLPSSDSTLCLVHPSGSRDDGSLTTVMKSKTSFHSFPSQETGPLIKCGSFHSCSNMFLGKPIDLEISGGAGMINEEKIVQGRCSGLGGNGVSWEVRMNEAVQDRAFTSSLNSILEYQNSAGDLETISKGRNHLGLNEQVQHLISPFPMKSSGGVYYLAEKAERQNLTANTPSFKSLHKERSQFSIPIMNDKSHFNSVLSGCYRNGNEQQMKYGYRTGIDIESLQLESKPQNRRKRKLFGVEITEEDDEPSLVQSDVNSLNLKSNVVEPDSSSFLSGRSFAIHFGQKVTSFQGNCNASTYEGSFWKLDSCWQNLKSDRGTVLDTSDFRNSSVLQGEGSHRNGFCVDGGSSIGFDIWNGKTAVTSVPHESSELKAGKFFKLDSEPTMSQDVSIHDSVSAESKSKSLPFFMIPPQYNCEKIRSKENSSGMYLDSFQKCSQHFFKKSETAQVSSQISSLKKESNLESFPEDVKNKEVGRFNTKKILGFPIPEMISKIGNEDPTGCVSEARCSDGNKCRSQLEANPNVLEKGQNKCISGLQHQIDLNMSITEEEDPESAALPAAVVNISATEIDLEIPAVIESEAGNGGTKLPLLKSWESHQEQIEMAAEAIVAISSALITDVADNAYCQPLETTSPNSLQWFADVISSCNSDRERKTRETSCGIDGCSDGEIIPDRMDYFEFMTLKLKDMKDESYCNNLPDIECQKDEETAVTATQRRSRRGQGRRWRQRKNFQRDTLPNLASLSKHEVVEDLQTLEELFQSTGRTWRSSLSQKNGAKNGRRGKNSAASLHTTTPNSTRLSSEHHQTCRQLQLTDKSLTGWGKRTRRFPRQRCSKNTCSAIKLFASA